jgi:hypothetical protein
MKRLCKNCDHWSKSMNGYTSENVVGKCYLLDKTKKGSDKCHRYAFPSKKVIVKHDKNRRDKELPSP